jgi:hypothetical protein
MSGGSIDERTAITRAAWRDAVKPDLLAWRRQEASKLIAGTSKLDSGTCGDDR